MRSNEITVMDLLRVEDGAHDFAQIYVELQKQAAIAQFTLEDLRIRGRGEWIHTLEDDVAALTSYLDIASELAAGICADLDDLSLLVGGRTDACPDDDCGEYPEEF